MIKNINTYFVPGKLYMFNKQKAVYFVADELFVNRFRMVDDRMEGNTIFMCLSNIQKYNTEHYIKILYKNKVGHVFINVWAGDMDYVIDL